MSWKAWYPSWFHKIGDAVIEQANSDYGATKNGDLFPRDPDYSIVDLAGKGKGMIAKRKIGRGQLIFSESPIFLYNGDIKPVGLAQFYRELPAAAKAALLSLANSNLPSLGLDSALEAQLRRIIDVCDTNCFDISSLAEQEVLGIFRTGSRINHSCSPNATRYFTGVRFEFRAVRTIDPGEEITITYIDAFRPCRERQAFLWKHWRFCCKCDACGLRGGRLVESDRRRSELKGLLKAWEPDKGVGYFERAMELLDQEGYASGKAQFCTRFVRALRDAGDSDALEVWRPKILEILTAERGASAFE